MIAHAAISSIQPSSGQGEPGETVSAVVSVTTSGLTSCLTAASDTTLVITFDGLTTTCGTGTWSALMEVAIPAVTPPGSYTVTVSEVSVGGSLLGTHAWPLQVTAPATTTTLLPEVTLFPTTTTTTATTTTDAAPNSTTTTTSSSSISMPGNVTSTTERQGLAYSPPTTAPSLANQANPSTSANAPATTGDTSSGDAEAPFSEIAVSSGLIDMADRALPPIFAQAVLSPVLLLEVLLRALGRTGSGLLIPLGVTILAGFGLARRLRRDVEGLPDLDVLVEIPDEDKGR